MTRLLQPEEVPLCIAGGRAFFKEAGFPGEFNPDHFVPAMQGLMASGVGAIIGSFGSDGVIRGALAAARSIDPFTGEMQAYEMFWFVLPEHRGTPTVAVGLLKSYERWARDGGCVRASMVHLHALQGDRLAALYERLGYKLMESAYLKILRC